MEELGEGNIIRIYPIFLFYFQLKRKDGKKEGWREGWKEGVPETDFNNIFGDIWILSIRERPL